MDPGGDVERVRARGGGYARPKRALGAREIFGPAARNMFGARGGLIGG